MKYLLDTHVFVWLDSTSTKLTPNIQSIIADPANTLLISLVSLWEIQIKHQLGKLDVKPSLKEVVEKQQQVNHIQLLSISFAHILALEKLPDLHRDPFDRLIVAQAIVEDIPIISHDPQLGKYPVRVDW